MIENLLFHLVVTVFAVVLRNDSVSFFQQFLQFLFAIIIKPFEIFIFKWEFVLLKQKKKQKNIRS